MNRNRWALIVAAAVGLAALGVAYQARADCFGYANSAVGYIPEEGYACAGFGPGCRECSRLTVWGTYLTCWENYPWGECSGFGEHYGWDPEAGSGGSGGGGGGGDGGECTISPGDFCPASCSSCDSVPRY